MMNYLNSVHINIEVTSLSREFTNILWFVFSSVDEDKLVQLINNNNHFNLILSKIDYNLTSPNSTVYKSKLSKLYSINEVLNFYVNLFKQEGISYVLK